MSVSISYRYRVYNLSYLVLKILLFNTQSRRLHSDPSFLGYLLNLKIVTDDK